MRFQAWVAVEASDPNEDELLARIERWHAEVATGSEYDGPCDCVGETAYDEACAVAAREVGATEDELRQRHGAIPEGERLSWERFAASYITRRDAVYAIHPTRDRPADDCDTCGGTGQAKPLEGDLRKWDHASLDHGSDQCVIAVRDAAAGLDARCPAAFIGSDHVWLENRERDASGQCVDVPLDRWKSTLRSALAKEPLPYLAVLSVHF